MNEDGKAKILTEKWKTEKYLTAVIFLSLYFSVVASSVIRVIRLIRGFVLGWPTGTKGKAKKSRAKNRRLNEPMGKHPPNIYFFAPDVFAFISVD